MKRQLKHSVFCKINSHNSLPIVTIAALSRSFSSSHFGKHENKMQQNYLVQGALLFDKIKMRKFSPLKHGVTIFQQLVLKRNFSGRVFFLKHVFFQELWTMFVHLLDEWWFDCCLMGTMSTKRRPLLHCGCSLETLVSNFSPEPVQR